MFQPACAASHRPAFSPTRGSGIGAIAETIGAVGFGMTAGGGGGGGGGVPRPPRPASGAVAGIAGGGAAAGSAAAAAGDGAGGGDATAGGAEAVTGGGGALGTPAAAGAFVEELAHAGTPSDAVASRTPDNPPMNRADTRERDDSDFMAVDSPASRTCD
jgi:hypothetical protein